MVGWMIAVIVVGSIIAFVIFLRFVFVSRRLKKSSRETALSRVPTIFGTLAPNAIHQKIHIKRIREHPPVVLTPGNRLGQSIRIPKFSFNFITLYSRFRIELDELDALDDVEAQYEQDPEDEVAAKPPKPKDIVRIWREIFPCFKSKNKVGVEELVEPDVPDDNSIEPNSAWVTTMLENADLNSVDSASIAIIDTSTGSVVNADILQKKRDRNGKKKRKKKPRKILTKREQVDMFVQHMLQKKLKKKKRYEKSLGGSWDDLDSLDRGSLESTSHVQMQDLGIEGEGDVDSIQYGNMSPTGIVIDQTNDHDTNLFGNDLENSDMFIDEAGDGFSRLKADDMLLTSSYFDDTMKQNNDTNNEPTSFVNPEETLGPESEMEGEFSDVKFSSPQSAYAGLTVGFHTTVSHGDSHGVGMHPGTFENASHPNESYGMFDWDSSVGKLKFSPEVNVTCAQHRLQRRAMRKQWMLETTGIRDSTVVNGGPPLHMIPAGYEICAALLSMEHHEIAYQLIMYLFDGDRDIAKGWFVGTLIGLSMIREGNYHVRFDVHETHHKKVHGIYKLDLALDGMNAYGKRWVILTPIV